MADSKAVLKRDASHNIAEELLRGIRNVKSGHIGAL